MNSIIINDEKYDELVKYKGSRFFGFFIFDEVRIILKSDEMKRVYKIKINGDITEVLYRVIKNGMFNDCRFSFKETEEGCEIIEKPNGELVEKFVSGMLSITDKYSYSDERIVKNIVRIFNTEMHFVSGVKQYIMNKSYERAIIQRESRTSKFSTSKNYNKKNRSSNNDVQFLLSDIIEYVVHSNCHHIITCEAWNVRGHFRHYKNGKVVWIPSYEKGKKRNTGMCVGNKVYTV